MNTSTLKNYFSISPQLSAKTRSGRYAIVLILAAIPLFGAEQTRLLYLETLSDAYIAVTVFVALTLLIFYSLEYLFRIDTARFLEKHRYGQIPIAALLGALPGCGGAIMVVTQYSIGRTGFGSVVAVLTSTMGDAAFLLLAKEPVTGFSIMVLSIVVGAISGLVVERIHDPDFLRVKKSRLPDTCSLPHHFGKLRWLWIALLIPGIVFGVLAALQIDVDAFFGIADLKITVGVLGAIMSVFLWFINPSTGPSFVNRLDQETFEYVWDKTTTDTCFVTVWVIIAFLLFEMTIHWTGWDLKLAFGSAGTFVPLMGIVIGLLPGCGPQVLTTGLYLQGVIPLSAQLGNSISNDGDALFPALAVAPKASIVATLYTAVPAAIVAYGYYFLFEL